MTHYDRVSASSLSEYADRNPSPERREIIIKGPKSLELDFNQQEGAQQEWKHWKAGSEWPGTIIHIILPLYNLLQMSDQDCRCSKNILLPTHCRYACDDYRCYFKVRNH